jgi:FkbM family methyltransferase
MNELQKPKNNLRKLSDLISEYEKLNFVIANIGCRPVGSGPEPFEAILEYFSGSKIIGFETDKDLCEKLNQEASSGYNFFYQALGQKNEKRNFYNTEHPMCSSLYQPNEKFLERYQALEAMILKNITQIDTVSLDRFVFENQIEKIDLIKIDIQGAELDVFKGGKNTLENTFFIISEVEFNTLYINQPLFGDVHNFLIKENFMFNKFLGLHGRTSKPTIINNNMSFAGTQHMWSDAIFVKDLERIKELDDQQVLKLAFISFLYNNPDMTSFCLTEYDLRKKTNLNISYINFL